MKYFYDTEFIDDGNTIDLISIGIVSENGKSFYAISNEFNRNNLTDWLKENVISKLPKENYLHKSRDQIRKDLIEYFGDEPFDLWGYYASYDFVAFCQLFGRMLDLPKNYPYYTHDIKVLCNQKGNPTLPNKSNDSHEALADALWNKEAYIYLTTTPPKQN